jgi:hypothetical protein
MLITSSREEKKLTPEVGVAPTSLLTVLPSTPAGHGELVSCSSEGESVCQQCPYRWTIRAVLLTAVAVNVDS